MNSIEKVKAEIEQLAGLSESDAAMFWALSRRCAVLAGAPAIAAGVRWGPGLIAVGTVALPLIGTVSGTTATLLVMGGAWGSSYGACMALLPGLRQFRDTLRQDLSLREQVRREVRLIVLLNGSSSSLRAGSAATAG